MSKVKTGLLWLVIIVLVAFLVPAVSNPTSNKITYAELISKIKNNDVTDVAISYDKETARVKLKNDETIKRVNISDIENLMTNLNESMQNGSVKVSTDNQPFLETISNWILPISSIVLIFMLWTMLMSFTTMRQGGGQGGQATFGKSKARMINQEDKTKLTFKDVAGIDEEKEELEEVVEFLKNPKKFTDMGARIPKGVLLVGQPGTGKTLLAKAVAGEAGVPFFFISGSDFVEMYVGVGASRVRDLFQEAKRNAPCIIFIDEIDAVGRQRGAGIGGGHDEREQTLNQMLVEIDGFSSKEGVIVLAATNRPDVLDKALLRPGRFDRQIVVPAPDVKAREQILAVHSKKKTFADDVDMKLIAKNTSGFVGADLENLLNEAALLAARQDHKAIEQKDIEDAMVKVTMGPEKRTRVRSDKEKRLVAYHEGGHAVVSKFLSTQDPVHEISIIPRGMAGGYTMYRPSEDKSFISKTEMEEQIISLLGGRERATAIAKSMITKYGMNERLGTVTYGSESQEVFLGRDLAQEKTYSEETAAIIDEEIKKMIATSYQRAKELLEQNRDKLDAVAKVLIEREKITEEEFNQVFEQN